MVRLGNKSYNDVRFKEARGRLTLTDDEIIFLGETEGQDPKPLTRAWEWNDTLDCCIDFVPQNEAVGGKAKRCLYMQLVPPTKGKTPEIVHLHVPDGIIHELMAVVEPHLAASRRKRKAERRAARRASRMSPFDQRTEKNTLMNAKAAQKDAVAAPTKTHKEHNKNALGSNSERPVGARHVGFDADDKLSQSERPARRSRGRSSSGTRKENGAAAASSHAMLGSQSERPARTRRSRGNSVGAKKEEIKEMGSKSERINSKHGHDAEDAIPETLARFSVMDTTAAEELQSQQESPTRKSRRRRFSLPIGKLENLDRPKSQFSPKKLFGASYSRMPKDRDETKKPTWRVF